jgi:hypothetical protein
MPAAGLPRGLDLSFHRLSIRYALFFGCRWERIAVREKSC